MKPIKVLYINGNIMKRGGIEAFMMNYFRNIDKSVIHIDFVVHGYEEGCYDNEIIAAGSKIYHVPTKSKHPFTYAKRLEKIFKSDNYSIVHSHLDAMSGWSLKIAKQVGIPVRIAHSHNTALLTKNPNKIWINEYAQKQILKYATNLFACSEAAGEWLFGKQSQFQVINNAIDVQKYQFNEEKREEIRTKYFLQDKFVIGCVGRFDYQKNQEFLIPVLEKVLKEKENAILVFLGEGNTMKMVNELAKERKVEKNIVFLGAVNNVFEFYNAFDLFVLPSRFEGLCFVAIEAQTNGLECILSDQVTRETKICTNTNFLSLEEKKWANEIIRATGERNICNAEQIKKAGYSIVNEARKLQEFYLKKGQ